MRPLLVTLCSMLSLSGCVASHMARSVGEGNLAFDASLGGPLTSNLGPPVPLPVVHLGARYGLTDWLDVSSHLNVFGFVSPGLLALSTGLHAVPIQPGFGAQSDSPTQGWSLATSLTLDWMTNFGISSLSNDPTGLFRVYPTLSVYGGYRADWFLPFWGAELTLDFFPTVNENDRRGAVTAMIHAALGVEWLLSDSWSMTTMVKLMSLNLNVAGPVDWIGLFSTPDQLNTRGVVTILIGLSWAPSFDSASET